MLLNAEKAAAAAYVVARFSKELNSIPIELNFIIHPNLHSAHIFAFS